MNAKGGLAVTRSYQVADDQLAFGIQCSERPGVASFRRRALGGAHMRFLGIDEAPKLVALDMPATLDATHVLGVVRFGRGSRIGE